MPQEIEQRFLITKASSDLHLFLDRFPPALIKQGYFEPFDLPTSFRVRITNASRAEITIKKGWARIRNEEQHKIGFELAKELLSLCRPWLEKYRVFQKGWEIDFFLPPLNGIVLAEQEVKHLSEFQPLPSWIGEGIDITDTLTNLHFAKMATLLRGTDISATELVLSKLRKRVKKIVITGPPGSGKSTAIKILNKELKGTARCIPEVASILIGQCGITPGNNRVTARRFQETLYPIQHIFECTSAEIASDEGEIALICDRGKADAAAYFTEGIDEYEEFLKAKIPNDYAAYDLVLCLALPPRDVYESIKKNNPSRNETYAQAKELEKKIINAWQNHPKFVFIQNGESWEEKMHFIRHTICSFLNI